MGNNTITANEWLAMEILWRDGEVKSATVSDELKKSKGWASETTRTYLRRLITKGVAASRQDEHDKRIYWYYPIISKEEYIACQTKGHLRRYYGSRLPQLVAGLLKDEHVSEQELNELEHILKHHANKKED